MDATDKVCNTIFLCAHCMHICFLVRSVYSEICLYGYQDGGAPLLLAARMGHLSTVLYLVGQGVNIDARNEVYVL